MANYLQGEVVMNSRDIDKMSNYKYLHRQSVRNLFITVEVLDKDLNTIDTIQGLSTGGSITISNNSLIRRTGSLSFTLIDMLLPKEESLLYISNRIRVYAGLQNLASANREITHFCLGTFYITEPDISISADSREVSISLEDNMLRWEQEELETTFAIEAGTPLHTAVESTMRHFGEENMIVSYTELTIPHRIEFSAGDNVMSILTKLRDLYMDWECFYDTSGTLIFRKMDVQIEDGIEPAWVFKDDMDYTLSFKETFNYRDLKNRVIVLGSIDNITGLTPKSSAMIVNTDSPFHESKIGIRKKVISESTYSTNAQCDARARYELFRNSTYQEKISISTIPLYFLDGNDTIEVVNPATNELETYQIDSIDIGLDIESDMSIGAHKLYYDHFEIPSQYEEQKDIASRIEYNILNNGWLSIPEQRVLDYYGLSGSGNRLSVRFEKGTKYGTTAYVTGYLGQKTQTLTIDLADFDSIGENGDSGLGKGDYNDRILGHEILHAIMNDSFTIEKSSKFPEWFKEGSAEFLHGADERLKNSIVDGGRISDTKLKNIIAIGKDMMTSNSWKGVSDNYSASYLILKYLDKNLLSSKTMKNVMDDIRVSKKDGYNATLEAIVNNTSFANFSEFIDSFIANASNYVKTKVTLNIGTDEVDTGSIAGSDHRGSIALNAESVFDNSKATKGLAMKNFIVDINKP